MMKRLQLWWNGAQPQTRQRIIAAAHRVLLARMQAEALVSRLLLSRRPRVIATACWHFPIYSQTFVYREIAELKKRKLDVRFLYSELTSRSQLADDFPVLWKLKRMLILTNATARLDLEHYRRRMPERVDAAVSLIARASGMTEQEVVENEHFLHAFSFTRMV